MDEVDKTFDWHAAAVRGERGPIDADNPKAGFYRTKGGRNGPLIPIAFWYDTYDGTLRCHKNGKSIPDMDARELWVHASKNPIADSAYWHRIDTGAWLDDDASAVTAAKGPDIDPATDPVGSMKAEIEKARTGLPTYKAIDSDEQAARAQTLRSALTALAGKAEKQRKALKQPHIDAGKKVDEQWMPLSKSAQDGADDIRKALSAWETIKLENQRRADEETRKRQETAAREADWKAAEPGAIAAAEPPPVEPVKPNTPPPAMQIRGASGRTASVQLKKVVTAIDMDKAFAQFRNVPELYKLLLDLSQKVVTAGYEAVGATIEERADVR